MAADVEVLAHAWEVVRRNDEADGIRSSGVDRFGDDLTTNLERISAELLTGTYRPAPLQGVTIPKPGGGIRKLKIPVVADRVVERALAEQIAAVVDPWLSPWSFAYRRSLSVADAHRLLAVERNDGATHVVRADLRDCFDTLDRDRVLRALQDRVDDPELLSLVDQLCDRPSWWKGSLTLVDRGVAQGSPLSPMLCNLYLDALDHALIRAGIPAVRFADDLALPAAGTAVAASALTRLHQEVLRVGLELNPEKTEIMSFAEGFAFLGEEFAGPFPLAEAPRQQPDQRTLYVGRQGASVHLAKGKVVVSHGEDDLLEAPMSHVGRLVLFGAVGLSSAMRSHVLYENLSTVFLSRRGNYLGRMDSGAPESTAVRRRQYAVSTDPERRKNVALRLVLGKIANQRALLLRYASKAREPAVIAAAADDLDGYARIAEGAEDVGALLGMEGVSAQRYFQAFGLLFPEGYDFPGRRRRPPTDVVNSMLSLGYACLTGEAVGAAAAAGLDPAIGVLHADADRHSLALDLMEEFRPVVVDTVVLGCARRSIVAAGATKPDPEGKGLHLTDAARVAFLKQLEERMLTLFGYAPGRARVSYRRALHLQARQLAKVIRSGAEDYEPIRWR